MEKLNPPSTMQRRGNLADNWKRFNSFQLDSANLTLSVLMAKFTEYFVPIKNVTFERYKFCLLTRHK